MTDMYMYRIRAIIYTIGIIPFEINPSAKTIFIDLVNWVIFTICVLIMSDQLPHETNN